MLIAFGLSSSLLEVRPPIDGLTAANLRDVFDEAHFGHRHEAIDIPSPRGTPVRSAVSGTIRKLFLSKPGGHTIYEFDEMGVYCYYYAHLDRYAEGLREGDAGGARRSDRVCGIDGRRGSQFTAFAFCDLRAWSGEGVVERKGS